MRKNTMQVFEAWQAGKKNMRQTSIWTDGHDVYSYGTMILKKDQIRVLNRTKYSRTTTQHQNNLAVLLNRAGLPYIEIDGVYIGTASITEMTLAARGHE